MSYYSPEMVDEKGYRYKTDIWSLGILLFKLLFGFKPFKDIDYNKLIKKILKAKYKFP